MKIKFLRIQSWLFSSSLLILIFIGFSSCEKDLYDEGIKQSGRKADVEIKNHTWKELSKDLNFVDAYDRAMCSIAIRNFQGKEIYGKDVDTTLIKEVIKEGYKSYSIRILTPEESERHYQNLVIELDSLDKLSVAVFKYYEKPTKEIDSIKVDYIIPKEFMEANETGRCNWIEVATETTCYGSDAAGDHYPGDGCNCDGSNPDCHPPSSSVDMYVICTPPANTGMNFTVTLGNMSQTHGGGHGGSFAPNQGLPPDRVRLKNLMMHQLDPNVSQWLSQHEAIQGSVWSFLENVPIGEVSVGWSNTTLTYPQELVSYVNNLVQQMMNSGMTLNPKASYISPAFIDLSSVSGNSPEENNFKQSFETLQKSPLFRQMFYSLFNETPTLNLKFQIVDDLANGAVGSCSSYQVNPGVNALIKLKRSYLQTKSKIFVMQVILHEMIHAYIRVKLITTMGMNPDDVTSMDFQQCLNIYFQDTPSQIQHNFFLNLMIPTMTNIFMEVKDFAIPQSQQNSVINPTDGNAILYYPTNTTPATNSGILMPWSWSDYFQALSLEGLQNCMAWPEIYPNNSPQWYIWQHYSIAGQVIFIP